MPDYKQQNNIAKQSATESLLVIGYVWPEPNSSAAGKHMLSLLKMFLQQGIDITFASPASLGEHKYDLTTLGIDEVSIALNCSSFDKFIEQLNPNYVLFDRFMMEEQFGWRVAAQCPNALRILDTEDLHFLRHARHQTQKKQHKNTSLLDCQNDIQQSDLALREIAAIYRSDLTLIISQYEMNILTDDFSVPQCLLHYCPFMLELATRSKQALLYEQRQHFVSIGNFRHAPNWDAVLYLNNTIWPLIRKQLPDAELHVFGAYPPPKATQLHNPKKGFYVDGWVNDAQKMLENARVLLAPLRFGAGLKGKLTDAMMTYTPSVTTSMGAQGMAEKVNWPGLIADSPEAFAHAATTLYSDAQQWRIASAKTTNILCENFDFDIHAKALWQRITQTKLRLTTHRLNNFTGRMLQHHSMKSTQYMAQWIEAKNRNKAT
ncbi:MAG: glycosyltransferase family 4 protein [Aliiglaciecola sp.]